MENTEIVETLEKLNKLSYEGLSNELENYPIETLELLAVNFYKKNSGLRRFELLDHILSKRFIRLNKNFEWTNENKQKFLNVGDKYMQTFELAYNEALSVACELENRIKNNDRFVKDYEIDIKITPYMDEQFYDNPFGIGFVLSEPLSVFSPVKYSFGHEHYNSEIKEKPIYLDKSFNSNREYFGNIFKDDYICYGIHQLLENDWSFNDIINIKRIWADVEVTHQYYIENI